MSLLSLWVLLSTMVILGGGLWAITEVIGRLSDSGRYPANVLLVAMMCLVSILCLFTLPTFQLSLNTLCQ